MSYIPYISAIKNFNIFLLRFNRCFNPDSAFYYYNFYCNINCNVGSHRKKHNRCTQIDMSLLYSCCIPCTRPDDGLIN